RRRMAGTSQDMTRHDGHGRHRAELLHELASSGLALTSVLLVHGCSPLNRFMEFARGTALLSRPTSKVSFALALGFKYGKPEGVWHEKSENCGFWMLPG